MLEVWGRLISFQGFPPFFSSNQLIIIHKEANVFSGFLDGEVGLENIAGSLCSVKNRKVHERQQ